jgi:hypothetical protein
MLCNTIDSLQSQVRAVHESHSRFQPNGSFDNLEIPHPSTAGGNRGPTSAPATPPIQAPHPVSDPPPPVASHDPSSVVYSTPLRFHNRHQDYPSPPPSSSAVTYGGPYDHQPPAPLTSAARLDPFSPTRQTWAAPGLPTPSSHAYDHQAVCVQQAMFWNHSPPPRPFFEAPPSHSPPPPQPPPVALPPIPYRALSGSGSGSSGAGATAAMRENPRPNSFPTKLQRCEETILRVEQLVREAEAATEIGGENGSTQTMPSGRKRKWTDGR